MKCERDCGRRAVTCWWQDERDLTLALCGPHSDQHADALCDQGWQLMEDERVDSLHPVLPALSADPATH